MAKTKKTFSEQVKFVRMTLGLSQTELANDIGVSYATISRWEREVRTPQMATLGKLYVFCKKNGIDIEAEMDGEQ